MNYYEILGVAKNASQDQIKQAYRKLSSQYHPDKHPTPEAKANAELKYKEINAANDVLSNPQKRSQYDELGSFDPRVNQGNTGMPPGMADIIRAFHERAHAQMIPNIRLGIDLRTAFKGSTLKLNVFNEAVDYVLRPGLPPGVSFADTVKLSNKEQQINIHLMIHGGEFRFTTQGTQDGIMFSGDLEREVSVNALDIMLGGWIKVHDFLGDELQVRVPQGFDLKHRLKVSGKGYSNWRGDSAVERGDMYLSVIPKFENIEQLDKSKVQELYDLTFPKV